MDDLTIGALLREVTRLYMRIQREDVSYCNNTTSPQCSILTELGRSGPIPMSELGRRLGLDKAWISRVVESLVQEGLLTKMSSAVDHRMVIVVLPPAGEDRNRELNQTLNAQAERVMSRIPADERAGVFKALRLLQDALQAEATGAPVPITFKEEPR